MSAWEAPGATDEWYTPPAVFEALGCHFDTDVAHPGDGLCHVPAQRWIMTESLQRDWRPYGFVWMNPPFGGRNAIAPWLTKFFDHGNGCGSAWKKDPGSGVIGVEKGPLIPVV